MNWYYRIGQQCIELNIENMGSQDLQKTIIDREESNLKISSVNLMAGPAGRAQCALGTAIWFNSTSLFAQPGCDVKLQVCFHLHYGDTRDFNSAEGKIAFGLEIDTKSREFVDTAYTL